MKACGLIVEYNPFHYGHLHHLQQSKTITSADCMIAVMSGNFLQRGEPAIIDKFHRAQAAMEAGIDLVVELPYAYAVQHSDIFAEGATKILDALGVSSVCFGSENGNIHGFTSAVQTLDQKQTDFQEELKRQLAEGLSFPEASRKAYQSIGLTDGEVDLSKPNNILGFSYTKSIYNHQLAIQPTTIKRIKNDYHDTEIDHRIASATSIRKELLDRSELTNKVRASLPISTQKQLLTYKQNAHHWHQWSSYFHFLQYRVNTMTEAELQGIHGVEEGLEYRIKRTALGAVDFESWMHELKTKRYTWTRLQRVFANILTNTTKQEISPWISNITIPYIRILAMNNNGRSFLHQQKKQLSIPLLTGLKKDTHPLMRIEEKASDTYYSIIHPTSRIPLRKQEIVPRLIDISK
ncbi:nucleotidyltransferase [Radiobacillus sp. PE A8.2]|uniref:nucleotidyltransferase n=1 Tax=Radiobacillus sp. PE A8.2 TaxID=3380349 RepID=UPI003890D5E3